MKLTLSISLLRNSVKEFNPHHHQGVHFITIKESISSISPYQHQRVHKESIIHIFTSTSTKSSHPHYQGVHTIKEFIIKEFIINESISSRSPHHHQVNTIIVNIKLLWFLLSIKHDGPYYQWDKLVHVIIKESPSSRRTDHQEAHIIHIIMEYSISSTRS